MTQPYTGGGNELYLKLTPMTLRWDFYSAEAPGDASFNDGMSIDIVAANGTTVIAHLAYADTFSAYNYASVDASPPDGAVTRQGNYAQIARAGLDVPFRIPVERPGGFDQDVTVAVSSEYLDLFDRTSVDPEPAIRIATRAWSSSQSTTTSDMPWTAVASSAPV